MEELPTLLDEESDGSPTKMASTSTNQLPLRKRGRLQVFKQEGGQLMFSRPKYPVLSATTRGRFSY
jgi:hypothetical protein